MARPILFFGRRNIAAVVRTGEGELDHTEPFDFFAQTNPVAPAGIGGECIFTLVYLTLTFTESLTLYVTPHVDKQPLETQEIELVGNGEKQTKVYEVGISIPLLAPDGGEQGRYAARGTWFQLALESRFDGAGVPFAVEAMELDYEPVSESKTITGAAT